MHTTDHTMTGSRSEHTGALSRHFADLRDGSHGGGLNSVTLLDTGQKLSASFAASEKPS